MSTVGSSSAAADHEQGRALAPAVIVKGSRRIRIAVYHDLPSGGAKRTVHAQVRELVRRGHQVECFVTSSGEEEFMPLDDVADRVTVVAVPEAPERERMLKGRPTPSDLMGWTRVFLGLKRAAKSVAETVSANDFDVLLVHPSQFTQAPHVLRLSRIPTVYYCHEVLRAAHEPLISPWLVRVAIRFTLGAVDRRQARAATTIATNSSYTSGWIQKVYGRDARVAPPGVDTKRFRPGSGVRDDYLLAVGALHPLKGMEFLVEAVSRLPAHLRLPMVIVSDRSRDREQHRLQERADALRTRVVFRGRISEDELVQTYQRARAVVFAPHNEPLGLVPLEAMACGTPVVAVAEGGIPETMKDGTTGFLSPRDPDVFARRIRMLLKDPGRAEELGSNGRQHVEHGWSWKKSVDRLEALLLDTRDIP